MDKIIFVCLRLFYVKMGDNIYNNTLITLSNVIN